MNKCKECPFQYIDYRKNWKCRRNNKVVNAYGCEEDLSVEILKYTKKLNKEVRARIESRPDYKSDMLREKQDYADEVKLAGGKVE